MTAVNEATFAPDTPGHAAAPPRLALIGQVLCVVVPLGVWFMPVDIDPVTKHGLAISMFMVTAWITQAMDYTIAGFIGCFLFWALRLCGSRSLSAGLRTTQPGSCSALFYLELLRRNRGLRDDSPILSCSRSGRPTHAFCLD